MKGKNYKGMIGAIIVTLALISSVFIGYAVNVDKTTVTDTDYEYVTDVSGLFSYDQTPTYVDYDVSKNYNGYSEYTSNTTYSTTDTYTNTAISGETWYKGTTYTGAIPYGSEYNLYIDSGYMHIDGDTVTYTVSGNTTTYNNVTSVVINSSNITINNDTVTTIDCTPSSIIYQYVSGYDALGTGTTTLYKLSDGTTYYFTSANKVYQIEDNTVTEITSSSSGIIAYGNGYTGIADNTYIDSLFVTISTTGISVEQTNAGTMSAKMSMTTTGHITTSTIFDTVGAGTYNIYHSSGKISFIVESSSSMTLKSYDIAGNVSNTVNFDGSTTDIRIVAETNWGYIYGSSSSYLFRLSDPSIAICDNYDLATLLGFNTNVYSLTTGSTYYYNSTINAYSFANNMLVSGVSDATTRNNICTGTVTSSVPIFTSGLTVTETGTEPIQTTYSNTRSTDNAIVQIGISPVKTISEISYELYSGNYHVTWNGTTATVIESGTTDTVTLTTAMTISSNTLTITGTSTRYSASHTYTISLAGNTAIKHISGNAILTGGTAISKLSGTAYYKSTSNTYGYISNTVTTSLGGTSIGHGVYSLSVGTTPVWTSDSLSVVSDSYTAYDMTQLAPTSNIGITYTTTSQPNAYVVGSVSSTGSGSKALAGNSYTALTVPDYTYALYNIDKYYSSTLQKNVTVYEFKLVQNAVTLTNYVASLGLPASTTTITLSFSHYNMNSIYFGSKNVSDTGTYPYDALFQHLVSGYLIPDSDFNTTYTISYDVTANRITNLSWYGNVNLSGSDYALYYNASTYSTTGNYGGYAITYDTETGELISKGMVFTTTQRSNIIYSYAYSTPTYMDVNRGIKINAANDHSVTRWSNGYNNGSVSIVFHAEQNGTVYSNSFKLSTGNTIAVSRGSDLHTNVSIDSGTPVDVGVWPSFLLSVNGQTGSVTVEPIDVFYNYTTISLYDYTYVIGSIGGNKEVSYIDFNYATSSFGISVYQTKVFLNTYGAVMNNPTINVTNYFPNIEDIRINFRSFAIYGNTITINGTTFYGDAGTGNIIDTGKIYYSGKSYVMQDMYVTYNDDKTYLTFNDDNVTIDLGDTTTKVISMTGFWYFTTELYKGVEVTHNSYEWHPENFAINMQGLAILAIGLTLLGTIIARRFMNESMTAIDYILIIGAIAVFGAMLGGIML